MVTVGPGITGMVTGSIPHPTVWTFPEVDLIPSTPDISQPHRTLTRPEPAATGWGSVTPAKLTTGNSGITKDQYKYQTSNFNSNTSRPFASTRSCILCIVVLDMAGGGYPSSCLQGFTFSCGLSFPLFWGKWVRTHQACK